MFGSLEAARNTSTIEAAVPPDTPPEPRSTQLFVAEFAGAVLLRPAVEREDAHIGRDESNPHACDAGPGVDGLALW